MLNKGNKNIENQSLGEVLDVEDNCREENGKEYLDIIVTFTEK